MTTTFARAAQYTLVEQYLDQHFDNIEEASYTQDDDDEGNIFVVVSDKSAMVRFTKTTDGETSVKVSVKQNGSWSCIDRRSFQGLTEMGQDFVKQMFAL